MGQLTLCLGPHMPSALTLETLHSAVAGTAAALRSRTRLQPAGGPGARVMPPTFAGAVYQIEFRRVPGREGPVPCVVLDTVQSQANRMEEALLRAWEGGRIRIPVVATDFSKAEGLLDPIGKVTSLEAPHRIADAIFRDSDLNGSRFRSSNAARRLDLASPANATPLYQLCPTALVFGIWDSTGPKGGLGVRFERVLVSEIVGIGLPPLEQVRAHRSRGVRRDPLGVRRGVQVSGTRSDWKVADGKAKGAKPPSEINHGNVPFESENAGVTVEYAEQTITLSLIGLRRLRFPIGGSAATTETDAAGRTVLAALGLCGAVLASENGLNLRSNCVLWPEDRMTWELLETPGQEPRRFHLTGEEAIGLLNEAVDAAGKLGLAWLTEPLMLTPSPDLVELVRRSQKLAVEADPTED